MTPEDLDNWERLATRIRVNVDTGCWEWTGYVMPNGYGMFRRHTLIHRASYRIFRGGIPPGLEIDHLCRVRHCCNPWHLETVTAKENTRRGRSPASKRAAKTHCMRGHEFDEANTRRVAQGRVCIACERINNAEYSRENRDRINANARRRSELRRSIRPAKPPRTHCKRGHELVGAKCKRCLAENTRRYRERVAARRV